MLRRPLVRLVDDDRVVAAQVAVALQLGEQDAVGHQLDPAGLRRPVGEPHLVADQVAELGAELVGDPLGHRPRRDPARLGVADHARSATPATELEADLRQLGGLPRAGLAGDDHDLVVPDRRRDVLAPLADRQLGRVGDLELLTAMTDPFCRIAGCRSAGISSGHDPGPTACTRPRGRRRRRAVRRRHGCGRPDHGDVRRHRRPRARAARPDPGRLRRARGAAAPGPGGDGSGRRRPTTGSGSRRARSSSAPTPSSRWTRRTSRSRGSTSSTAPCTRSAAPST